MICTAAVLDLISLIPIVNIVVDVLAWLIFFFWFRELGFPFTKNNKLMGSVVVSFIIGFIPILSILPEITLGVLLNILIINGEQIAKEQIPMGEKALNKTQAIYNKQPGITERSIKPNRNTVQGTSGRIATVPRKNAE